MIFLTIALIIIDQVSKYFAVQYLKPVGNIDVIPGLFSLSYVENSGVAFGMLQNARWVFIPLTTLMIIFGICYVIKKKPQDKILRISITLLLAGAIGNLIDRIFRMFVVDMFRVTFIDFPVFNIADCCVVIGAILLCVYILFLSEKKGSKDAKL